MNEFLAFLGSLCMFLSHILVWTCMWCATFFGTYDEYKRIKTAFVIGLGTVFFATSVELSGSGHSGIFLSSVLATALVILVIRLLHIEWRIRKISEVLVDGRGNQKFIVAQIISITGYKKLIVRTNKNVPLHVNILEKVIKKEIGGLVSIYCIGGGSVNFSAKNKTIHIYGESQAFGKEPDRELTFSIIKRAYPDFQVFCK